MSIPKNDNLLTNKKSHMNKIRNKVQLIGNVGAKPNIEQTKNGHVYTKISLATNEFKYDASGEKSQHTLWHQVIA